MENIKINVQVGETFRIGKYEFIRFPEINGAVPVVFKDMLFKSSYGYSNDLSTSDIISKLSKTLADLEKLIGIDNILEFETDLVSMGGSRKNGKMKSKISLPTFDFYRENRTIFEKNRLEEWWWLATSWDTSEYTNDYWVACVSPLGGVNNFSYSSQFAVRPFLHFSSSIFDSLVK